MTLILAIVPVLLLIVLMAFFKMPGDKSSVISLIVTMLIALFGFHYAADNLVFSFVYGALKAVSPILIIILLAIFSLWQMPHSYAIAIFRFKDYQAANIPVLPVVKGISVAKNHITLYIIAFAVATLMLSLGGYAGYKYLVVAAAVSVWWLGMALVIKLLMTESGRASCSASLSSPSLPSR